MNIVANKIVSETPEGVRMHILPGPARFVVMILLVLLAVAATTLAVVFLIPDGNDYARASVLKHERLASLPSPKIVLIGGSNLAYGIDSAFIEQETKCPVVNMGINGYLGSRYMLEEVTRNLKKSDIVVISFEYQNFYNSVEGLSTDQLMLAKVNSKVWSSLTLHQKWRAISSLPLAAQQKIFRIIKSATPKSANETVDLTQKIETFAGFNKYGDLTSHLELEWPYEDVDRFPLSSRAIDADILQLLQSFSTRQAKQGVHVLYSYSPLKRDFYETHKQAIASLHDRLVGARPLTVLHPPAALAFDAPMFFDSIYHLNAKGRAVRSRMLAQEIRRAAFNGGDCATGPIENKGQRNQ
jgi:hypothetical protein